MVTAEDRMKILKMLQEGKINPESAAQLLEAMDADNPVQTPMPAAPADMPEPELLETAPVPASPQGSNRQPRWLRVRVTDTDSGRPRVNVRMPIQLVNLGLKMGSKFSPEIEGLDIAALLKAAQEGGTTGTFVDVIDEEDGEHVEVFLE